MLAVALQVARDTAEGMLRQAWHGNDAQRSRELHR